MGLISGRRVETKIGSVIELSQDKEPHSALSWRMLYWINFTRTQL